MAVTTDGVKTEQKAQLALEVAELFPPRGQWTEQDYFALPEANRHIELSEGTLIMPPHPTDTHQRIAFELGVQLRAFVSEHRLGKVRVAPLPVRLWPDKIREPDVLYVSAAHADRVHEQYYDAPDLVMEVISPSTRRADLMDKMSEYAKAGIAEYWLVDTDLQRIDLYMLSGGVYELASRAIGDEEARSTLLEGFRVRVQELFAAE